MNRNLYWFYSLGIFLFLGLFANPAFAEVDSIQAGSDLLYNDGQIKISGTVEAGSTGLVTIVIRDQNDEFVLLTHSEIHHDDSFEKKINIEDQFIEHGRYYATGFILNMTDAETVNFDISPNGLLTNENVGSDKMKTDEIMNNGSTSDYDYDKPAKPLEPLGNAMYAFFLNSSQDPSYYVERYYSEPHYKSWFDRNYPGQTNRGDWDMGVIFTMQGQL